MPHGYLLHSRPYGETSLLATFLTDTVGRLDMLLRSGRRSSRSAAPRPVLFALYELDWVGKSDLKTLRYAETQTEPLQLAGVPLYCGFYLNELLHRLTPLHVPEPELLYHYGQALAGLATGGPVEPVLRCFELELLECLGYGLDLVRDMDGLPLEAADSYCFLAERGLRRERGDAGSLPVGSGADFLAMAGRDFSQASTCHLAKRVLRLALATHLGARPLNSRALFQS